MRGFDQEQPYGLGGDLDAPLRRRWIELSELSVSAAKGPAPSEVNESLRVEAASEPESPVAPAYQLWIADNLVREGRDREAIQAFDKAIEASNRVERILGNVDIRGAALHHKAGAQARRSEVQAAVRTLRELADFRGGDRAALYEAGRLADRAGRTDQAADLYRMAASAEPSRATDAPGELARRALLRLEATQDVFSPTDAKLIELLTSALERRDPRALGQLASTTHFASGPVGSHMLFEEPAVLERLLTEVGRSRLRVDRRVRGTGRKRYLRTRGWKGPLFRRDVYLVLTRAPQGWQWTGVGIAFPTDDWVARWSPRDVQTNQLLPFPLLAPWPAGQSFTAGGLTEFIIQAREIESAGLIGGAILAYIFSLNDCGFGVRGSYYNQVYHTDEDAFAIDFTRYRRGVPFDNVSGGTPVLAPLAGMVVGACGDGSSGEDQLNSVEIMHPDPATGTDRFLSRYLHLAGRGLLSVSPCMAVLPGYRLGLMDDTGNSLGDHLHFSIHDQNTPFPGAGTGCSGIARGASVRPSPMEGVALTDGTSGACIRSTNREREFLVPIWLNDVTDSDRFVSQHYVHTQTADRLHLWTLTGVVILHLKGVGPEWRRGQVNLGITVPEIPRRRALQLKHWAPMVTINAIANDGTANWAGWAADWFRLAHPSDPIVQQILVECQVAVRDSDGWVLRLGYEVTLAGTVVAAPPVS